MSDLLIERHRAAGLTAVLPASASAPTLLQAIGVRALLQPTAMRPASVSVETSRVGWLAWGAGIDGLPELSTKTLAFALTARLPQPMSGAEIVARAATVDDARDDLMPVARAMNSPEMLPLFKQALGGYSSYAKVEALAGIAAVGSAADAGPVIGMISSDDEEVAIQALATLVAIGAIDEAARSGALDPHVGKSDHEELVGSLIEAAHSGAYEAIGQALSDGGWEKQLIILRLAREIARARKRPDGLFEAVLEPFTDLDDTDVLTTWVWAAADAAPSPLDAADALLDLLENESAGQYRWSAALTALGRLSFPADSRADLAARILELDPNDDEDAKGTVRLAIGRIHPAYLSRAPGNDDRFLSSGYGRLEDLMDGMGGSPTADALLGAGPTSNPGPLLGMLATNQRSLDILSLASAALATWHPGVLPVFDEIASDRSAPTDTRIAMAGTLLNAESPVRCPATMMRCLIGADAGGPLPEDPEILGELLAASMDGDTGEAATQLLRCRSAADRKMAASFFDWRITPTSSTSSTEVKARIAVGGVPRRGAGPSWTVEPLFALQAGRDVPVTGILAAIHAHPDTAPDAIATALTRANRDTLGSIARTPEVLGALPDAGLLGVFLALGNHSDWVQKEGAGIVAQTHGARLLASAGAEQVAELLIKLTADDDSDVTREADAACDAHGIDR